MKTRLFTHLPGLALAVLFTMLVGSVGADDNKLEGTWDVTLQFPEETCDRCGCPGNTPDIPLPTLNTFLKGGGMLWSGSALTVGPGQGSWERLGRNHYMARFKFFIFALTIDSNSGSIIARRTGSEELTKDIRLTDPDELGRDTFEATTTFDLFDVAGTMTAQGCIINETATRFE
jgi:hypothetical protein